MKMNIREKLFVAPGSVLLFLVAFGIASIVGLRQSAGAIDDIYQQRFHNFQSSARALDAIGSAHAGVYRLFTWMASYKQDQIDRAAADIYKLVDGAAAEFKSFADRSSLSDAERKLVERATANIAKYRKAAVQAIDIATVDANMGISAMQTADGAFATLHADASELVTLQESLARASYESAGSAYRRTLTMALLLLAGAIGASLVISVLMARAIVTPLNGAIRTARQIAAGDLTESIAVTGSDETAQLLHALSDMQDSLRNVIGELNGHAGQLSDMAASLSAASAQMASGTTHQSEAASSMAAAVEEMTVSITQISNNASDANDAVQQSGRMAGQGKETIRKVADAMQRISLAVNDAATVIATLGQQSEQIGAIVNVITEIADQTNLLALNAAIEAARAGDQGRGFAVVADEVRQLAQRTAQSTQEITNMIKAVQENARRAVQGMNNGVTLVSEGTVTAAQAEQRILEIESGTLTVNNAVEEISTALKQQSLASQEIAKHVERIAQMAEETSSTSRTTATSASQVNTLADAAKHAVGRFRL